MSSTETMPDWAHAIDAHARRGEDGGAADPAAGRAPGSALAFCRLLEGGCAASPTRRRPDARSVALRQAAHRVDIALDDLEDPLGRYLLELEAGAAEGRSWFGEPSDAELIDWRPVLERAGVSVSPHRVVVAYLELAVLVRALEGLSAAVRWDASPDRGSLWAGLFDLRENLFDRAQDELRALSA